MADTPKLEGYVSESYVSSFNPKNLLNNKVTDGIKSALKTAAFLESMRNINWSRGYCWFAELDGVPAPFHRGGAIGLPLTNVTFKIAEGTSYKFNTSTVETLDIPLGMANLGIVTLDMYDDEQQTLAKFFERWYNQVYNPYRGVLPITEACKQITIYKQKSTRRNVKRIYYNLDDNNYAAMGGVVGKAFSYIRKGKLARNTEGFDFLVFPEGAMQFNWGTDANELNKLSVSLTIAHFINQDFGDPVDSNGVVSVFDNTDGIIHTGRAFLDRLADYI